MNKLIIQIPCFNEEQTLPETLRDLPHEIAGVDTVEWLIVDDGSTDNTVEVARANGVDHIVSHTQNQGLARAFQTGMNACLERGADIIVNTDADNQYCADDIPKLAEPIVRRDADIVIGERPIWETKHFSYLKKLLQRVGSWTVRLASGTEVQDAPSGFRAFSRDAALKLNVFNEYTYTLETIIQAGKSRMAIASVPIRTNPDTRPSRLVRSIPAYLARCAMTILRTSMTYRPFRTFAVPGLLAFVCGLALGIRFLFYFFVKGNGDGHVQSLILTALLVGIGFFLGVIGLLADLISVNRKLLEQTLERVRRIEVDSGDSLPVLPNDSTRDESCYSRRQQEQSNCG